MGKDDMIYLFSGTPGSGKSLDMARNILNDLRNNKPVICNFPISVPKYLKKRENNFHFWDNDTMFPGKLISFANNYFANHKFREGSIVLYIDECQLLFNARTWNIKGRSDWNAFFTNHRHFGYDIILVAQFDRMIDKQIRSLIEYELIHRKVNNLGLPGIFFRVILFSPTLFVRIKMYYPLAEKVGTEFFRYSDKYSKIYNSYSNIFIQNQYSDDLLCDTVSCDATEPEVSHETVFTKVKSLIIYMINLFNGLILLLKKPIFICKKNIFL